MAVWKPRVIVIGAGVGGIAAGVRMLEDGLDDLLIVDRADGVGGVWRANTYPGAQCDVPSHLYSLSFHPKPDWRRRYGEQPEILDYLEEVSAAHGLTPYLRFRTEVTACEWDDAAEQWLVRMRDLESPDGIESIHHADVVIVAAGQLSMPAVPELKGLDSFAGKVFHSARWRHDVDLTGQRVAVIGTGASAIQFVPAIAPVTAQLDLFQRTAPYTIGKSNRRYSPLEQSLYARFPVLQAASRLRQYLWHEALGVPFTLAPRLMALPQRSWKRRMHRSVPDHALREKLTPDYLMGCKRLLLTTDWYRTLRRANVDVITAEIDEVLPDGIRTTDGEVHPADVLIFGTGFAAGRFLTPMRVTGRAGRDLQDVWQHGARAYLGTVVPGFPNLFILYGPGTGLGHTSIILMIESQLAWIRSAVSTLREQGLRWIDVRPEVQSAYDARFRAASARTVWESGCTSWYTVDGKNINNWPGTTIGFRRRTRRFRIEDVESRRRVSTSAADR
jgi:cation diffusion facilitator CzcD-associated flavoprotein CzcO